MDAAWNTRREDTRDGFLLEHKHDDSGKEYGSLCLRSVPRDALDYSQRKEIYRSFIFLFF